MDTPYAFVARIEAKPEKAEDLAALLTGALPLAQAEPGTVDWYAARTSPTTFGSSTRSAAKMRAKHTSTARSRPR
jgi:hypothetical protein